MQIYTNFCVHLFSSCLRNSFAEKWNSENAIPKLIHNSKPSPVNGLFICHFHNSICQPTSSKISKLSESEAKDHPVQHHEQPGDPKFSKFTTAAVSLSYTLSKFITRVFLLIMKNISHLNQYDQWPQHQNQNLSNSPPPHRAMIDWPTTGWPARKHKTPQLRVLGTHSDSVQNQLILICPPDMYFISASVLSGYWKISLCDDHS